VLAFGSFRFRRRSTRRDHGATALPSDASSQRSTRITSFESELGAFGSRELSPNRHGEITEDPMPHYLSDVLVLAPLPIHSRRARSRRSASAAFAVEIRDSFGMRIAEGSAAPGRYSGRAL
jgi:hypothetical protein